MILSRNYQAAFFSSTSFIYNIPFSRQHIRKLSNFWYFSPRTYLQNIFPRRGASLSKEDNQVNWQVTRQVNWRFSRQVALGPQQATWEEPKNASKLQASNETSGSACLWSLSFQGYFPEDFCLSQNQAFQVWSIKFSKTNTSDQVDPFPPTHAPTLAYWYDSRYRWCCWR